MSNKRNLTHHRSQIRAALRWNRKEERRARRMGTASMTLQERLEQLAESEKENGTEQDS